MTTASDSSTSRLPALRNVFESERLLYRAVDADIDEELFIRLSNDSISTQLVNSSLRVPASKESIRKHMKRLSEDFLLGVIVCLKSSEPDSNSSSTVPRPLAIGRLQLSKLEASNIHHRHTELGIILDSQYQGKGYGAEAIMWATAWAFQRTGLHRVEISTSEYNERGIYLYQRLGFTLEGKLRQHVWHDGQYWDYYLFGMLSSEWKAIRGMNTS